MSAETRLVLGDDPFVRIVTFTTPLSQKKLVVVISFVTFLPSGSTFLSRFLRHPYNHTGARCRSPEDLRKPGHDRSKNCSRNERSRKGGGRNSGGLRCADPPYPHSEIFSCYKAFLGLNMRHRHDYTLNINIFH